MPEILARVEDILLAGDVSRGITRKITRLSTALGKFSVRPNTVGPVGSHPVHLDLVGEEEIDEFWTFYDTILGACEPFWLPTFQRDFVPLGTVGAADVTFDIQDRLYTDLEFPDPLRRKVVAVFPDGTMVKREITDAESNGDGTETLTLNAAFGQAFTQQRNNGICYLLYGRLSEDKVRMDWMTHTIAEVDFAFLELREESPAGSTL